MKYRRLSKALLTVADGALNGAVGAIAKSLPDGAKFEKYDGRDFRADYTGRNEIKTKPDDDAVWLLGYSKKSLVPDDVMQRTYYAGGYYMPENGFSNSIDEVVDDMCARVIALDDGSNEIAIFAEVDCIGISNDNVRLIRSAFEKKRETECPEKTVVSVNVCSTHTHSCIDTQGMWTGGIKRILNAFGDVKKGREHPRGVDDEFRKLLVERVSDALIEAVKDMRPGVMKVCSKHKYGYFENRNRPSATALDSRITRLTFTPDDGSRPTMTAFMAAHPDVAGMPTGDGSGTGHVLSGDYVYYCGELVEKAGFNFAFFNGAVCGIYANRHLTNDAQPMTHRYEQSVRYGREIAKILLSMTMTPGEVKASPLLYDEALEREEIALAGGGYTPWHEGLEPVAERVVEPYMNVKNDVFTARVTNPVIILAGKLDLTDVTVYRDGSGYFIVSEVGFLELGGGLKAALVPGEFCQDLLFGGESLKPGGSFSGRAFPESTVRGIFGEGVITIGLANDEIGYVVPDNDYIVSDFKNHYQEELALGRQTGSAVMGALRRIKERR